MPKKNFEDKDVMPGDRLAVIEVFQDGSGAYQQEGNVRSEELGKAHFDFDNRNVSVEKKTRELILPEEGMEVLAEAGSVLRRDARVDIFSINGKRIYVPFTGVIHISDAGPRSIRDLGMAVRNGDIVKARIINVKNRLVQLSMRNPEYGVVYAHCSRCGGLLELNKDRLNCPNCDRVEGRKMAKTYGKEELE